MFLGGIVLSCVANQISIYYSLSENDGEIMGVVAWSSKSSSAVVPGL